MINTAKMTAEIIAAGWTQQRVANYCGVSQSTVGRWLKGKDPEGPNRDKLLELHADVVQGKKRRLYSTFDPSMPDIVHEEAMTIGEETGAKGIPEGTIPQIDVMAGMGAGGVPIVSEGVIGKSGMTFAAEAVADYWRLPTSFLAGLSVRVGDLAFFSVRGDSMYPTLQDGEVVAANTRHRLPSPDGIYALGDEFGGIVVKRLQVVSKPGDEEIMVDVISDNPHHKTKTWRLADLRIIGMIVIRVGRV